MKPAWHEEARALRGDGKTIFEIARAFDKEPGHIRWVLNENGERERQRSRARNYQRAFSQSKHVVAEAERIEPHTPRQPARILPAPSDIMALCRQFAEHKIDYSELSRRLRVSG
jgi:hypothetical protein